MDISGITEGGLEERLQNKVLSGGVMCDGLGSSFAALFGVLPNTSFSQNVGLVAMNKVVNRFCIATGGIFLIACGLFPKLAALISIMPQSVLGGAACYDVLSIVVSGIQLITKWTDRTEKCYDRFRSTWSWLWTWLQYSDPGASATGDQPDLRRFRYCSGSGICDYS